MPETAFGRYLRIRRVAAKLSLRAVADALGVSHVYLGEVERGARAPIQRDRWPALVQALPGTTMADLEREATLSRPVQLDLASAPPAYQSLGLALARRIQSKDLDQAEMDQLLRVLVGGKSDG